MRRFLVVPAFAVMPALVAAQTPAEITTAAETITAQEVGRHMQVMADDSMKGRNTPSPGLEATARYVASQFKELNLRTAAGNGTWFQRYQIPPQMDLTRSQIVFQDAGGAHAVAAFTSGARLADRTVPERGGDVVGATLIAGPHTPQSLGQVNLNNRVVVYVSPQNVDVAAERKLLDQLQQSSRGVVILSDLDSTDFAQRVRQALAKPDVRLGTSWSAQVRPASVAGLPAMLDANGVDLKQARVAKDPVVRELPSLQVALSPFFTRTANDSASAPNVIGVLEGSDPKLKEEYIVFVAHMDHTGVRAGKPDSIANGADDNASGTAGLLALAKAFSQPGARPARSFVFVATSGGAKNLWGSREFVDGLDMNSSLASLFGGFAVLGGGGPGQGISFGNGSGNGNGGGVVLGGNGVIVQNGVQFSFGSAPSPSTPSTPGDSASNKAGNNASAIVVMGGTDSVAPAPIAPAPIAQLPIPINQGVVLGGPDPVPGNQPQGAGDVSIGRVVGVVNLDMIGRHAGDSVMIDGVNEVEVPTPPAWIAAAHPELRLTVVNGGSAADTEADHYPFVQQAVPSLFVHNGWHDAALLTESMKSVDTDLAARIVRLVFYVGQDIGNGKRPPQWNAEGRRSYLDVLER